MNHVNMDNWKKLYHDGTEVLALQHDDTCIWAKEQTISGDLPLNVISRQPKSIKDWTMYGKTIQNGTPTPDAPIDIQGVGERTANLFEHPVYSEATSQGITFTPIENGMLYVSGTPTGYSSFALCSRQKIPANLIGQSLTFNFVIRDIVNLAWGGITIYDENQTILYQYQGGSIAPHKITMPDNADTMTVTVKRQNNGVVTSGVIGLMLNAGSTALPYEPYGYKVTTTNRGKNLFDKSTAVNGKWLNVNTGVEENTSSLYWLSEYIPVKAGITYSFSNPNSRRKWFYNDSKTPVNELGDSPFTPASDGYVRFTVTSEIVDDFMLNFCSTVAPYEPYREPITTTVYLGQTQTVRRIKKLVLTGNELVQILWGVFSLPNLISAITTPRIQTLICDRYVAKDNLMQAQGYPANYGNNSTTFRDYSSTILIRDDTFETDTASFKSYLAAQYAAGTPVTIWYVLAEPEAVIVNEPLMKIGDYADELRSTEAGVAIPTAEGTNIIDTDTTVKGSARIKGRIQEVTS